MPTFDNKLAELVVDVHVNTKELDSLKPLIKNLTKELGALDASISSVSKNFNLLSSANVQITSTTKNVNVLTKSLSSLAAVAAGIGALNLFNSSKQAQSPPEIYKKTKSWVKTTPYSGLDLSNTEKTGTVEDLLMHSARKNLTVPRTDPMIIKGEAVKGPPPLPKDWKKRLGGSEGVAGATKNIKELGTAAQVASQGGLTSLSQAFGLIMKLGPEVGAAIAVVGAALAVITGSVAKFISFNDKLVDFKSALNGIDRQTKENVKSAREFAREISNLTKYDEEAIIALSSHAIKLGEPFEHYQDLVKTSIGLAKELNIEVSEAMSEIIKLQKGLPAEGKLREALGQRVTQMGHPNQAFEIPQAQALSMVKDIANKGLQNEYKSTENLGGSLNKLGKTIGNVAREIGAIFAPAVEGIIAVFQEWMEVFETMTKPIADLMNESSGLQATIKTLTWAFTRMASPIISVTRQLYWLYGIGIKMGTDVFGPLITWVGEAASKIATAGSKIWNGLGGIFQRLIDKIPELIRVLTPVINIVYSIGESLAKAFGDTMLTMLDHIVVVIEMMMDDLLKLERSINNIVAVTKFGLNLNLKELSEALAANEETYQKSRKALKGENQGAETKALPPIGFQSNGEFRQLGETWKKVQEKGELIRMQDILSQSKVIQERSLEEDKRQTALLEKLSNNKIAVGLA